MLNNEEYSKKYDELLTYKVSLDRDPVAVHLSSLTEKLAIIQEYRNRIVDLMQEAIKNRSECEEKYNIANSIYTDKLDKILQTDPIVKDQKSDKLRLAAANAQLITELEYFRKTSRQLDISKWYMKKVENQLDNIDSVYAKLSKQIEVIKMHMNTGEYFAYPNEKPIRLKKKEE